MLRKLPRWCIHYSRIIMKKTIYQLFWWILFSKGKKEKKLKSTLFSKCKYEKNPSNNELRLALNKVTRFIFEFRDQNKGKWQRAKQRVKSKVAKTWKIGNMGENPSIFILQINNISDDATGLGKPDKDLTSTILYFST